jgi:hypothetical protein
MNKKITIAYLVLILAVISMIFNNPSDLLADTFSQTSESHSTAIAKDTQEKPQNANIKIAHIMMAEAEKYKTVGDVTYYINSATHCAKIEQTTLVELGYSEEHVLRLLDAGNIAEAHSFMREVEKKKTSGDVFAEIENACWYAGKAKKSLAELGYSKDYVHSSLVLGYITAARKWTQEYKMNKITERAPRLLYLIESYTDKAYEAQLNYTNNAVKLDK